MDERSICNMKFTTKDEIMSVVKGIRKGDKRRHRKY